MKLRPFVFFSLLAALHLGLGCAPAKEDKDSDTLVLHLGDPNAKSLKADLQRLQMSGPQDATAPAGESTSPGPLGIAEHESVADPEPEITPEPVAQVRTVILGRGETLYGLCRSQLGDGSRWKEVAQLNGWSEAQASNLSVGTRVKLPVD